MCIHVQVRVYIDTREPVCMGEHVRVHACKHGLVYVNLCMCAYVCVCEHVGMCAQVPRWGEHGVRASCSGRRSVARSRVPGSLGWAGSMGVDPAPRAGGKPWLT